MSDSPQPTPNEDRNTRLGLILFVIYVVLYAGFVLLSTFNPSLMENRVGGISLAVIYGMGLIVAALVLSLIYSWLCSSKEEGQ